MDNNSVEFFSFIGNFTAQIGKIGAVSLRKGFVFGHWELPEKKVLLEKKTTHWIIECNRDIAHQND